MMPNRIFGTVLVGALGCVLGCLAPRGAETPDAAAVSVRSPDGRNEIRLYEAPLRIEALRDGVVAVGQSRIGLLVDGRHLAQDNRHRALVDRSGVGSVATPVYKKSSVDLSRGETFADFGSWGVALVARNDGVAYRFETKFPGEIMIDSERVEFRVPDADAKCWANATGAFGQEESRPVSTTAGALKTAGVGNDDWSGRKMIYLPFVYSVGGKTVAVTESDVRDYPILNFISTDGGDGTARFDALFAGFPKVEAHTSGWGTNETHLVSGGRWVRVLEHEDFLVRTAGTRTLPWRTFVLADSPAKLCEADIVYALAAPQAAGDFSWVKPGKVAWDWWNNFDNADPATARNGGCTTATYERFIDFAAKTGVEYVILDEGWSEALDIWRFHPEVDVPHLIDYADKRGVGIILWMAWAQVVGEEERVAEHFAKLGARGFKVDFMDRGDAGVSRFLETFAAACAKNRMLVDYHGVCRPAGLHRLYPNVINYEGIHGLEQMKWFAGGADEEAAMMFNDVAAFYLRLTAGPMDYTPGAMLNHALGAGYRGKDHPAHPGSVGTRCRQMAMMALYEAPLQMLCDSPTNYERNGECFSFMAKTPVVWAKTVGLGGSPDSYALAARQAKDGAWYAAAINTARARTVTLETAFLGTGAWRAEIFRDGADADRRGESYVHETKTVSAGDRLAFDMAPGGGFIVRFSK